MKHKGNILIVDDEPIVRQSLYHWFKEDGYIVEACESGEEALKLFEKNMYDLILADIKMPGISGLDLLVKVKEFDSEVAVIMITAFASVPTAIKALKGGAYDYITKPIDPDELSNVVENAISQKHLKNENIRLKESISELSRPNSLIGESEEMKKVFELINSVSQTDTTVLIRGESGTGKELAAKAIHSNSRRKYFPIVTVSCGSLAESLLESELFGHEKGAFTGAHYKRKGKFEMAHCGSIFLDEIGTISNKMQVELLRVIETKLFTRVGSTNPIKSDFRVIAATNEQLEKLVKEGKFREDLYFRMNVFTINLPPLRERAEDIPLLAYHFLNKFCSAMNRRKDEISAEVMDILMKYNWPGNVRELENAIERAVVISKSNKITVDDLPFQIHQFEREYDKSDRSISALEKKHIAVVLRENNWNITKSAEALKIDRATLYNKINKYSLQRRM